jgi:hypothetical protein
MGGVTMTEKEIKKCIEIYKDEYPEEFAKLCDALVEAIKMVMDIYAEEVQDADCD